VNAAGAPRVLAALGAGAATVFGFAPFGFAYVPVVTLAFLMAFWQGAASPRAAAAVGFAFGIGLFVAGASWVFIALNTFGGMPLLLAGIGTAGFCSFLALYPALTGWLAVRWTKPQSWERALAGAAIWTLAEWARSVVFTGFPGSRSATRPCQAERQACWPGTHPSAVFSWSRLPRPLRRPRSPSPSMRSRSARVAGSSRRQVSPLPSRLEVRRSGESNGHRPQARRSPSRSSKAT
jgi:hypothetical protein